MEAHKSIVVHVDPCVSNELLQEERINEQVTCRKGKGSGNAGNLTECRIKREAKPAAHARHAGKL
jgi:hypothetical protein